METRKRTFPSTLEAAAEASDFILEVIDSMELPEEVAQQILLVIGEAVSNAAGHGNEFNPEKEVVVECSLEDDEVRLSIEDQGPGITTDQLENASLPDDMMQTRGRGLFIMKSLADRIWLEADGRRLCMAWGRVSERA